MGSGRQIHCDLQVVGKFYKFGCVKRRASPFRPPILLIDASSILRPVLALWLIVWTSATHVLFFGPSLAFEEIPIAGPASPIPLDLVHATPVLISTYSPCPP
jgi:hypothetical protein